MRHHSPLALAPENSGRVARYARGALVAADALDRIPTPLDDVTEALRLGSPQDLFELGDAPPRLQEIVRRLRGKVLGALSVRERVIYVDRSQSRERQRFAHGHELGHDALPWHRDAYWGDDAHTLHPETRHLLEAEANRFGADLLFQLDGFTERAAQSRLGLAVPLDLATRFEASRHASIRRYVETNPRCCALLVFGRYPVYPERQRSLKVLTALESPSFRERYGPIGKLLPRTIPVATFGVARDAYTAITGDNLEPIISGTTKLTQTKRGPVTLQHEIFSNTYAALALIYRRRPSVRRTVTAQWVPENESG